MIIVSIVGIGVLASGIFLKVNALTGTDLPAGSTPGEKLELVQDLVYRPFKYDAEGNWETSEIHYMGTFLGAYGYAYRWCRYYEKKDVQAGWQNYKCVGDGAGGGGGIQEQVVAGNYSGTGFGLLYQNDDGIFLATPLNVTGAYGNPGHYTEWGWVPPDTNENALPWFSIQLTGVDGSSGHVFNEVQASDAIGSGVEGVEHAGYVSVEISTKLRKLQ